MKQLSLALAAGILFVGWAGAAGPAPADRETALLLEPAAAPVKDVKLPPLVLKIAVNDIYGQKTACDCIGTLAARTYDTLLAELKRQYHITLEFTYFMEVYDLQKAVATHQFDGFLCKPWTVLQYSNKDETVFKRVADLRDPANEALMSGVFLTLAGSPLRTLADVQGKRIALGQTDSYEKNQAPLQMLEAKKIRPSGKSMFSSCGENLSALMDGKVDVAVVSNYALTATCAVDFAKPEQFRTLAETTKMPLTSLLVDMGKVPVADARRLQQALLELSGDKVPKDLTGGGFVLPVSWKPSWSSE
jgi:ABC-type phosphate/phosphonate transport system substrate-binding protein